ncbi:STN domain-containing protein [Vibrio rumoiensis]|uniref:STN domain-containing protein n=1 Tax=Vibrio rumoiensis TaxID=76258 RepID=UPI003AA88D93
MRNLWLGCMVCALLSGCAVSHSASDTQAPKVSGACDRVAQYHLSSSRFDETAQQLTHATGCFIQTDLSQTAAITVNPVKGRMSIREALARAIQNTPLNIVEQKPNSIVVALPKAAKK